MLSAHFFQSEHHSITDNLSFTNQKQNTSYLFKNASSDSEKQRDKLLVIFENEEEDDKLTLNKSQLNKKEFFTLIALFNPLQKLLIEEVKPAFKSVQHSTFAPSYKYLLFEVFRL